MGTSRIEALQNRLDELNRQDAMSAFNPSAAFKLAPNLLVGSANVGHGLLNLPSNMAYGLENTFGKENTLAGMAGFSAKDVPRQKDYDFAQMMGLPQTTADKLIQSAPQIPFFLGTPEIKAPEILSKIPAVGNLLKGAGNMIGRAAPQIGTAGALSNDPQEAMKDMGIAQGVMEALPLPFKAAGKLSEMVNPQSYASNLINTISGGYQFAKKQASKLYDPVFKAHGDKVIYPPGKNEIAKFGDPANIGNALSLDDDVVGGILGKEVKDTYNLFKKNPTLNNAKDLKSILGKKYGDLSKEAPNAYNGLVKQSINHARNLIDQDAKSFLDSIDPKAGQQWEQANNFYRMHVAPYRQRGVYSFAKGEKSYASPKQIKNTLRNALDMRNDRGEFIIPREHMLNGILEQLEGKINKADLTSSMTDLASGLLEQPGLKGAAMNMFLKPTAKLAGVMSNPYMQRLGEELNKVFSKDKKRVVSTVYPLRQGTNDGS